MTAVYGCTDTGFVALLVAASWAVRSHEAIAYALLSATIFFTILCVLKTPASMRRQTSFTL